MNLLERVRKREIRALARLITGVENRDPAALAAVETLRADLPRVRVIGFTGPPGAGKSTLISGLTRHWRAEGLRVGVLAVDPTSARTGGAVLGDRLRFGELASDPGVYVRSMASRGQLGGIAQATADAAVVVGAAGYDIVVVETVGVGQLEHAVRPIVATLVLVAPPGVGDEVQMLKAGLLEVIDVVAVSHGATPAAADTARLLKREVQATHGVPVMLVDAVEGTGVADLARLLTAASLPVPLGQARLALDPPLEALALELVEGVLHRLRARLLTADTATRLASEMRAGRLTRERALDDLEAWVSAKRDMS
jgi:LAO/AO transport system kinase